MSVSTDENPAAFAVGYDGRMLDIPFFAFWILLFLGREKLGLRGIAVAVAVWVAVRLIFAVTGFPPSLFVTAQAVMDIVLVLIVFGGDVKIT